MSITMSEAKIDLSAEEELRSHKIEDLGGSSGGSAQSIVGITGDFQGDVTDAIEEYIEEVNEIIEQIEAVETEGAFKGSAIGNALTNFVIGVKNVATSYTDKLRQVESDIIAGVQTVYETQDTDLSSGLGSDQSTIEGQGF